MPEAPIYCQPDLVLAPDRPNDPNFVRALQKDLRAFGYLAHGINGDYGVATTKAVRALQIDLLVNDGKSTDGTCKRAPVAMMTYNDDGHGGKPVSQTTGILDQALAQCLAKIVSDERVARLPSSGSPVADNAKARAAIRDTAIRIAPPPFVAAMAIQESDGRHFHEPTSSDEDSYVTIGLDHRDKTSPDRITSRSYGLGQYTFFHHPLSSADIAEYVADPLQNVQHAFQKLREKFDNDICGPKDRADDRSIEHPMLRLRLCRYLPSDQRFMRDCKNCAQNALPRIDIVRGTPAYQGASISYQPDRNYPSATYLNVPNRASFGCDWPYAARRYNGSGNDSFHYQSRILLNLLKPF